MSEVAVVPGGRSRAPYSVDDLFAMPDDGNRYEVLGGSLIVSPAPGPKSTRLVRGPILASKIAGGGVRA